MEGISPFAAASIECSASGPVSFDLLVTVLLMQCQSVTTVDGARAEVDAMLARGSLVVDSTVDGTMYLELPQNR